METGLIVFAILLGSAGMVGLGAAGYAMMALIDDRLKERQPRRLRSLDDDPDTPYLDEDYRS
jgi:hypothetical protein